MVYTPFGHRFYFLRNLTYVKTIVLPNGISNGRAIGCQIVTIKALVMKSDRPDLLENL